MKSHSFYIKRAISKNGTVWVNQSPLCFRFDIIGLQTDAEEDEAGIKQASENSKLE